MIEDFFYRLDKYMKYSNLNDNKLTVKANLSIGALGKQRKGSRGLSSDSIAKILCTCPDLSAEWLLTGHGNMTKGDDVLSEPIVINKSFSLRTDRSIELQKIPLYELEATAGLMGLFMNEEDQRPVSYLSIPHLPQCDGAIYVKGDSMYPLLKSGDIVVYKQINQVCNIIWGEMYLVSFSLDGDEYTAVKFINKIEDNKEYIKLVSQNQHHSPMDIPLSSIRALAIIKASIRFNTMG